MNSRKTKQVLAKDANNGYLYRLKCPKNPSLINRLFRMPVGYYSQSLSWDPEGHAIWEKVEPTPANEPYAPVYEPLFTKRTRNILRFAAGFLSIAVPVCAFQAYGKQLLQTNNGKTAILASLLPFCGVFFNALGRTDQKNDWMGMSGILLGSLTALLSERFIKPAS